MRNSRGDRMLLIVARLHRWASRNAELPAPAAQLRLLSLMDDMGSARIGDLANADNSSQPTMTTQVQRLEALGLVSRKQDERDARATLVTMTEKGREILEEARTARAAVVVPLFEGLSEHELAVLDEAIDIMNRSLLGQRAGERA